jgi:hypothetical protein
MAFAEPATVVRSTRHAFEALDGSVVFHASPRRRKSEFVMRDRAGRRSRLPIVTAIVQSCILDYTWSDSEKNETNIALALLWI